VRVVDPVFTTVALLDVDQLVLGVDFADGQHDDLAGL
jgi:hypothetical protein